MRLIKTESFSYETDSGLSREQVELMRQKYGRNELTPPQRNPWWKELLEKFHDPTIQILLVAAAFSVVITAVERYALGNDEVSFVDSIGIFLAVALATLVGFFSERKSAKEFELLNKVKEDIVVKVLRNGQIGTIPIHELVVGDLVRIDPGDKVPADGVLFNVMGLYLDQAMLTGESVPAKKESLSEQQELQLESLKKTDPGDKTFVARGTMVADGHGIFFVTAVGDQTQMGQIAQALAEEDPTRSETPLVQKLSRLAKQISVVGVVAAIGIFAVMAIMAMWHSPLFGQLGQSLGVCLGMILLSCVIGAGLVRYALKPFFARMGMKMTSRRITLLTVIPMAIAALTLLLGIWGMTLSENPDNAAMGVDLLKNILLAFVVAVTIIVVAVPEGLPMMVTISLALNMMKMARENCLVRKLIASETIGSATVICTDKTGTLTENRMTPVRVFVEGKTYTSETMDQLPQTRIWKPLLRSIAINSEANLHVEKEGQEGETISGVGNPTECALLKFLHAHGVDYRQERERVRKLYELGHNSERKMSLALVEEIFEGKETATTASDSRLPSVKKSEESRGSEKLEEIGVSEKSEESGELKKSEATKRLEEAKGLEKFEKADGICYVKGAPERVLAQCSTLLVDGDVVPIEPYREQIEQSLTQASKEALRVLAFSEKRVDTSTQKMSVQDTSSSTQDSSAVSVNSEVAGGCDGCCGTNEQGCLSCSQRCFVGLVGIADPVRRDVPHAVQACREAHVQVKMITGDSLPTAVAIATAAGIYHGTDEEWVLTSQEFAEISDEDLPQAAEKIRVLARSTPMDKLRLVKALHRQGEVVAMTGDGTNDAPALKYADVGVAMGITGTEVAKEASDIVLVDDHFKSIVTGVWWGRTLFQNIQRFLQFQLSVNVVALLAALIGPMVGVPLPLTVTQLLWINIIMDTFAALALSTDPPRPRTMKEKPIPRNAPIVTRTMGVSILVVSLYQVAILFSALFGGWFVDSAHRYDASISATEPHYLEHNLQALTVFFTILVMFQFWHKFNCRALRHDESPFTLITKNHLFLTIVTLITAAQIAMVQIPVIGEFFRTEPLTVRQWLDIALLTVTVIPVAWFGRKLAYWLGVHEKT